jgi:prolyl-tRNA synthetase
LAHLSPRFDLDFYSDGAVRQGAPYRLRRAGIMFADIELIGIQHRVVVSERGVAAGTFEYRGRPATARR